MWGALQGNSLIRTFRVGIRCSSLKMRKKSTLRAVLCGWCHLLLFIEGSCNIQSLTMTRRVSQVLETCGNHKGFHQRQMDFLCTRFGKWLFQRMEEEEHHLKSWKQRAVREMPLIISAVWYRRRSFSTALPLPPSRNVPHLRDTSRISCLLSHEVSARCLQASWLPARKQSAVKCSGDLPDFNLKRW